MWPFFNRDPFFSRLTYFCFHLCFVHMNDHKSRSISKKGVTSKKGSQFIKVKIWKLMFIPQKLISSIYLGTSIYNKALPTLYYMINCDPFFLRFCPKFCFQLLRCPLNVSKQRSVRTVSWSTVSVSNGRTWVCTRIKVLGPR